MTDETLETLRSFAERKDFVPAQVGKQSSAAKQLCSWCTALYEYATVKREIEPKTNRVRQAEEELESANANLAAKQLEFDEWTQKVENLQILCDETQREQERLQTQMARTQDRLRRAQELT